MAKMLKKTAKKFMANVPEEYAFHCQDGRTLKNINELEDALNSMSDEIFSYHSNDGKSDFSNWVRDIIKDQKLSKDLLKSTKRKQALQSVKERTIYLNSIIK